MTTTKIATIALLLALVACGSADDHQGSEPTSPSGASDPAAGSGVAAAPTAACAGEYEVGPMPGPGPQWLHRTAQGCVLGAYTLLNTDGTVVNLEPDSYWKSGHWNGDEFYFWVTNDNGNTWQFNRMAAEPSK